MIKTCLHKTTYHMVLNFNSIHPEYYCDCKLNDDLNMDLNHCFDVLRSMVCFNYKCGNICHFPVTINYSIATLEKPNVFFLHNILIRKCIHTCKLNNYSINNNTNNINK